MHFKEVKSILSAKNGINIYRGCTHGCIYCDSRSKVYSMDHKFEDVEIKKNAPELLEIALRRKREKCMIGTGSMSDPYIDLDTEVMYTRRCLEVIEKYGFGLSILTKSNRILRDLDVLKKINNKAKCVVQMTLTTADDDLCKILEPNVSLTKERFEVLKTLRDNNIQTVVWISPILPYINDSLDNIRKLISLCVEAKVYGIICFGMGLTLREGNREYFYKKLDRYFPGLKDKYQRRYGDSYQILSENNSELMKYFYEQCRINHIVCNANEIFNYLFTFEDKQVVNQMNLFDCQEKEKLNNNKEANTVEEVGDKTILNNEKPPDINEYQKNTDLEDKMMFYGIVPQETPKMGDIINPILDKEALFKEHKEDISKEIEEICKEIINHLNNFKTSTGGFNNIGEYKLYLRDFIVKDIVENGTKYGANNIKDRDCKNILYAKILDTENTKIDYKGYQKNNITQVL